MLRTARSPWRRPGISGKKDEKGYTVSGNLARLSAAACGVKKDGYYMPVSVILASSAFVGTRVSMADGTDTQTYTIENFNQDKCRLDMLWQLKGGYSTLAIAVHLD